jgi:hypothetical protein
MKIHSCQLNGLYVSDFILSLTIQITLFKISLLFLQFSKISFSLAGVISTTIGEELHACHAYRKTQRNWLSSQAKAYSLQFRTRCETRSTSSKGTADDNHLSHPF